MNDIETIRTALAEFKYSDYVRALGTLSPHGAKPLRVAVLRSYTVEPIEPVLKLRLLLEGFEASVFFGDYNGYAQEILNTASAAHAFAPDLVLLLIRIDELMPDFVERFGDRSPAEWGNTVARQAADLAALAARAAKSFGAPVIVQNVCRPTSLHWGIYDSQDSNGQGHLLARFNQTLSASLAGAGAVYVWDFQRFCERRGHEQILDAKGWFVSKSPYRLSAYPLLVDDLLPYVTSVFGKGKKCVVLDLDNTLWGGVIGEDGIEGIALGHTYPGNCFREFQRRLLALHGRGIILAINSKNNEADAFEAIDRHPAMLLRCEHFSAWRINWNDKAGNLQAIADELNIGIDSMILIDDNPAECDQVRRRHPQCAVVCVPSQPYLIPAICERLPGTEKIRLTEEDKNKGRMYRAQTERKREQSSYADLQTFLEDLKIEVDIEAARPFSVPRIAQLTQKTNQMNVTTRRYTEADISRLAEQPDHFVFSVASRDKFGDNGIVGVLIFKLAEDECAIDTLLLSCRVIGRSIEDAMVAFVAEFARRRGVSTLLGEFVPTAKNAPASELFQRLGFDRLNETQYRADLGRAAFAAPPYIHVRIV